MKIYSSFVVVAAGELFLSYDKYILFSDKIEQYIVIRYFSKPTSCDIIYIGSFLFDKYIYC